jgi:tellurite resistance protein TehA-like permease
MKTLIRTLVMLGLIVWLGAEIFFPVVAAVTFGQLPDTHVAGSIIGSLLRILHGIGLVSGAVLLALLALGSAWAIFRAKPALAAMVLVAAMLGLTAYSQYGIIPAMERDRLAAGGAIDAVPPDHPARVDFNRLHVRSTRVEGAVLLLGLVTVVLVAAGTAEKKGQGARA